ncbi:MAG TPA: hypothetical protein PKY87_13960, partial [Terricaulis sp.]|nr:hypothetical protein [Terricaulis sp.]
WRLGRITIDGVSGSWIGSLRAAHVRIADEEGVWLEAEDLQIQWSPLALVAGRFDLSSGSAARIAIARQPILSPPTPSSGGGLDVRLTGIKVDQIDLAEPVVGQTAQFAAGFELDLRGSDLRLLTLVLQRQDSEADRANVLYRPDGDYALNAEIASAPGGVLAHLLGLEAQGFSANAQGQGDTQTGRAIYAIHIGEDAVLDGQASWTPERWSAQGQAALARLPAMDEVVARIGESAAFNASGARIGAFELQAETPRLTLNIQGVLNEERELVNGARVVAETPNASAIAHESPVELGAARFEGELRRARGTTAIQGQLDAQEVNAFGHQARFAGPLRAALTTQRFELGADLAAQDAPPAIFAQGRLRTELTYNLDRARFE